MSPTASTPPFGRVDQEVSRLLGRPFDDTDDVIRTAVDEASVPALLMSMVHMTGDMGLLDELPGPFKLIAMDLQGAMSEPDKASVRERAFEVIRDYRDRGCPPPFVPNAEQMRVMFAKIRLARCKRSTSTMSLLTFDSATPTSAGRCSRPRPSSVAASPSWSSGVARRGFWRV